MKAIALEADSDLSLVPVAVDHAALLASLVARNSRHLGAYLPAVAALSSVDAARAHLDNAAGRAARGETLEWHVFAGASLCGAVRLKDIDAGDSKAEIGFFLGSESGGKGIALRSVRAVLAYAFASMQLNRIELRCAATNAPSIRLAERLGFTREGLLRQGECLNGVFVDQLVYGLLRSELAG
ncbi:GNAT family N-acetyltransferase [Massilia sp. GCM10023247]|uniref:GNAT family N-acetyltransferase n=1 Tax=Massilia sp. GCM10023247 TaxID=3252643 RepID=UPI0036092DDC